MRLSRRRAIQGTLALAVSSQAGTPAWASAVAATERPRLLFDSRYRECREFAAAAQALGAAPRDTRGDITAFYLDELRRRQPATLPAVGGLTPYAQMFGLKLMVEVRGMRLAHLAIVEQGMPRIFGPADRRRELAAIAAQSTPPAAAATVLCNWPATDLSAPGQESNISAVGDQCMAADTLVAWLLAPAPRTNRRAGAR